MDKTIYVEIPACKEDLVFLMLNVKLKIAEHFVHAHLAFMVTHLLYVNQVGCSILANIIFIHN